MGDLFHNGKLLKFQEIASTNLYAGTLPHDSPEGTIVLADYQTHGRGQGINSWESEPGKNLTFSILLKPHFLKASGQFYISKVISLALADFISLFIDNVFIKWPNDIYVGDSKIGGILIENSIDGQYISQTIAGIGININQKKFSTSVPNPISLSLLTNLEYDIVDLLDTLTDIIEYRYKMLKEREYLTLDENYTGFLYKFGQKAQFKTGNEIFTGTITGVESTGELIISDDKAVIRSFTYKEVTFLIENKYL